MLYNIQIRGKSKFTVVHIENNAILNNEHKNKLCVSHTHYCKPTFAPLSLFPT